MKSHEQKKKQSVPVMTSEKNNRLDPFRRVSRSRPQIGFQGAEHVVLDSQDTLSLRTAQNDLGANCGEN